MVALREIRKKLGMSQADLAKLLDVSQAMVSFYETGTNEFPVTKARVLIEGAGCLGVDISFNDIYEPAPCAQEAA